MRYPRLFILLLLILPACRRGPVLPDYFSPDDQVFSDWWKISGFFVDENEDRLMVHSLIQHSGTSDGEVVQFRVWIMGDKREATAFYQSGSVQTSREGRFPVNIWAQIREDYRLRFRFGRRGMKLFFRPNTEGPGFYRIKAQPGEPDTGESERYGDTGWNPATCTAPDGEYNGHARLERLRDIPSLIQTHRHMYWIVARMEDGRDISFGFHADTEGGNPEPFPIFKDQVRKLKVLEFNPKGPFKLGFEIDQTAYTCEVMAPLIPFSFGKADTWSGYADIKGENGSGIGFAQYFVR